MYHDTAAIPTSAANIRASLHGDPQDRTRVLTIGDHLFGSVRIHIQNRPVLDALQAALDEIRADMDTAEVAS